MLVLNTAIDEQQIIQDYLSLIWKKGKEKSSPRSILRNQRRSKKQVGSKWRYLNYFVFYHKKNTKLPVESTNTLLQGEQN